MIIIIHLLWYSFVHSIYLFKTFTSKKTSWMDMENLLLKRIEIILKSLLIIASLIHMIKIIKNKKLRFWKQSNYNFWNQAVKIRTLSRWSSTWSNDHYFFVYSIICFFKKWCFSPNLKCLQHLTFSLLYTISMQQIILLLLNHLHHLLSLVNQTIFLFLVISPTHIIFTYSHNFTRSSFFFESFEFTSSNIFVLLGDGKESNKGVIIGAAIGVVSGAAIIAGIIAFFIIKKNV